METVPGIPFSSSVASALGMLYLTFADHDEGR